MNTIPLGYSDETLQSKTAEKDKIGIKLLRVNFFNLITLPLTTDLVKENPPTSFVSF